MPTAPDDERVLILAPTGRDAALVAAMLHDGRVASTICRDADHLCTEMLAGAGVALIAEEAFAPRALRCLLDALPGQAPWSELPLIVLSAPGQTSRGSTRLAEVLEPVANVTHIERPVRPLTLASTVRAALRARRRQYQVRDLLATKEQAIAEYKLGLRQRDEFLAMLGHELRNPLATIGSCLKLLEMLAWRPDVVQEQRRVLERQTQNLARMVDDLLDVARITNGAIALQRQPLDIGELARRCAASLAPRFESANVTLLVDASGAPATVDGDAVRLEQVVTNLLTNALKFTPAGGTVTISTRIESSEAVLSVRDTGMGIPPEMLVPIFDLFAQAHVSIDRSRGGLGLGLTIVQRLLALHGGSITAHSAGTGLGSEFVARLPLLTRAPAEGRGSPQAAAGARRVLLVEDNADARLILQQILQFSGHEVEVAEDGPSGLDKALALHLDVVVLDVGLPGCDGYEVARRLRAHGRTELCLIALTGYGQSEDRARAIEAGFNAHLVKPVDFERLSELISKSRGP